MTHSPSTWVFITLASGGYIVVDLEIRGPWTDDNTTLLSKSKTFDDNGQEMEEATQ